jgi:hypothetical protein
VFSGNKPPSIVHSVQVFVSVFFSKFLFTNSSDGASVGCNRCIGSPNPIVCEGIAPIANPAVAEKKADTAAYRKNEAITSKKLTQNREREKLSRGGDHIYEHSPSAGRSRHPLSFITWGGYQAFSSLEQSCTQKRHAYPNTGYEALWLGVMLVIGRVRQARLSKDHALKRAYRAAQGA